VPFRFLRGGAALVQGGLTLLRDRRLRRLALAPVLITLVLAGLTGAAAWHFGARWVGPFAAGQGTLLGALVWIGFAAAVVAATLLAFLAIGQVATSPFSEPLTARAEELAHAGAHAHPEVPFLVGIGRDVSQTVLSMGLYVAAFGALVVAQLLLPELAPVTALLELLVSARFLAYDAFDSILSRHGFGFAEKRAYLAARRAETTGLGVAMTLGAAVPLLGLIVPPAAKVAAALLYSEWSRGEGQPPPR
jgi:uncharacterized protein involved in cysteine biosynthesis